MMIYGQTDFDVRVYCKYVNNVAKIPNKLKKTIHTFNIKASIRPQINKPKTQKQIK